MKKGILLSAVLFGASLNAFAQFWDYTNPEKLMGNVNGEISEEGIPILTKDYSTLFFVRTFEESNTGSEFDQDIWMSTKESDGSYSKSNRLDALNNKFNNAVVGISSDGNALYLLNAYAGKKDQFKGISRTTKKGAGWSIPTPIVIPGLDVNGEFYQFHVSEKEDVILISYAGDQSLGQEDLYVSIKTGNEWSALKHMGSTINSTGFEISPFLCATQDTLFFSSNGFGGEGDADIFYSVKQGSWTNWSKPVNLGNRINSPKFDGHFAYHGQFAYWASNRGNDKSDIYTIEILIPPSLSASCLATNVTEFDAKNGKIDVVLEGGVPPFMYSWSNGKKTEDLTGLGNGDFSVTVTDAIGQIAMTSCMITEPAPPENKEIRLPEVRYPLNQWSLLSDNTINSPDSLLFVYELLTEFPDLVLELSSHTDSRGSNKMNQKLSENRARACYKYLVEEKGIDPRRIIPVGIGENKPQKIWKKGNELIFVQPIDMTGVKEVLLTESFINQYKQTNPALFEALHQLNRRTEGRVIGMTFNPKTSPAANPKLLQYVSYP
jgi:peptidoglycan-associated lipoprotein